jgi:protein-tyrosine phosphatase
MVDPVNSETETVMDARIIRIDGASNIRDLGGIRTRDGYAVRRGRLYRSARLSHLTDAGRDQLRELGIRVVCDLRGDRERERDPGRVDGVVGRLHPLPIEPTLKLERNALAGTGFSGDIAPHDLMVGIYRHFAVTQTAVFSELLGLLVENHTPLLFHCTAGKDRTGFGAAIILRLLGADMDAVLEDYLLTNEHWQGTGHLSHLPDHVRLVIERVDVAFLLAAFESIDEAYGSFDRYAEVALGFDRIRIERLRELFLEPLDPGA